MAVGAAELHGEAAAGLGEALDFARGFGVVVAEQPRRNRLAAEAGALPFQPHAVLAASRGVAQLQLVIAGIERDGARDGAAVDLELGRAWKELVATGSDDGEASAKDGPKALLQGGVKSLARVEIEVRRGDDFAEGDGAIGVGGDEAGARQSRRGDRKGEQKRPTHASFDERNTAFRASSPRRAGGRGSVRNRH